MNLLGTLCAILAEMASLLYGLAHFDLLYLALAAFESLASAFEVVRLGVCAGADVNLGILLDLCGCAAAKQRECGDKSKCCVFHVFVI